MKTRRLVLMTLLATAGLMPGARAGDPPSGRAAFAPRDQPAGLPHRDAPGSRPERAPGSAYRLPGIDFGPFLGWANPNHGAVISEPDLLRRMSVVAPYVRWVRTYGATHGLERTGAIAHRLGLKAAIGAWLGRCEAANEAEIRSLLAIAAAGDADLLVVGSEALLRGDLTEEQLLRYLARVKGAARSLPVAYADTLQVLLAHPSVMRAVDIVMLNLHPYWAGVHIDSAVAALHRDFRQVAAASGKRVFVSEAGWPSAGNPVGQAVPSPKNASRFLLNAASWARAQDVTYFHFAAFDERWKVAHEGTAGGSWGIWNEQLQMKAGMKRTFDGEVLPDNWSAGAALRPPRAPFATVPKGKEQRP